MNMFNTLKSVLNPSQEQKEVAANAAKTCKGAAFIMGKHIFLTMRKIVFKLLEKVHLERFATPVTVYLLLSVVVALLRCIPGIETIAMSALNFLANIICVGIVLVVAVKLFKFARRCYAEAKEELANQSQEASEKSEAAGKN